MAGFQVVPNELVKGGDILTKESVTINEHSSGEMIGSLVLFISPNKGNKLFPSMSIEYAIASFLITFGTGLVVSFYLAGYLAKPLEKAVIELRNTDRWTKQHNLHGNLFHSDIKELSVFGEALKNGYETIMSVKDELHRKDVDSSIARTGQMLAHDVRKPFSMISSILKMLDDENNPALIKKQLPSMLDDIQLAMTRINGMIRDVMEIGAKSEPIATETSQSSLIEISLSEVVRMYPDAAVNFKYELADDINLKVDSTKVLRVYSNIISNAFEAMMQKGQMWFKSSPVEPGMLEIIIGNDGPVIPSEILSDLFESFFTSGKQGGTGLGLAIAKKIVEIHGGTIRCNSNVEKGTEFIFTLPIANQNISADQPTYLPNSSMEIVENQKSARRRCEYRDEKTIEDAFLAKATKLDGKVKVLIVDDEQLYRQALIGMLSKNAEIDAHVEILQAENAAEAEKQIIEQKPHLVTLDIDLGKNSKNGLELLAEIRNKGFGGYFCIHSNRLPSREMVADSGADDIQPKPMSRIALLGLLLGSLPKGINESSIRGNVEPSSLPLVAVVDDTLSSRCMWRHIMKDAKVELFDRPETFLEKWTNNVEFAETVRVVIVDLNFGRLSSLNGFDLAHRIKKVRQDLTVLLSSDAECDVADDPAIDAVISKEPMTFSAIMTFLNREKSYYKPPVTS